MVLLTLGSYLERIKEFEGLRLEAYKPKGEKRTNAYTIGYGHFGAMRGDVITESQAEALLLDDLHACQSQLIANLGEELFLSLSLSRTTALIDFVFNLGIGNFNRSTLRKKMLANISDHSIQYEFLKWNRSGGKQLRGLTKRCCYRSNLWVGNYNQ